MPTLTQVPLEMAVAPTWDEINESGGGTVNFNNPTFEKKYQVTGLDSETAVVSFVEAKLAAGYNTLNVNDVLLSLFEYKIEPQINGRIWMVTLAYRYKVDYFERVSDSTGGTIKVLQALDQGSYYKADALLADPQPDFHGLIGVDGDTVHGVDVPNPKHEFSILIRTSMATMPADLLEQIEDLTGFCNQDDLTLTWNGQDYFYGAEELLFLGIVEKETSDGNLEATLKFSVSRSAIIPPIGDSELLNGDIVKIGQRYLWVYAVVAIENGWRVPRPAWIVINKVIRTGDFTVMGIFS